MHRWTLCALLVALPMTLRAQPLAWRFDTDGDMQGWTTANFENAQVQGGMLRGLTKYDPMLMSPPLQVDAARYPIIEFRVSSSVTGGGEIFWHGEGEVFSEERMSRHVLQAASQPLVYRVNLGDLPAWRGTTTGIRLDLLDTEGAQIALDYVRFLTHMPGAAPNESFEDDFDGDGRPDVWAAQAGQAAISAEHATDGDRSARVTTGAGGKAVLTARAPIDLLGVHSIDADVAAEGEVAALRVSLSFLPNTS